MILDYLDNQFTKHVQDFCIYLLDNVLEYDKYNNDKYFIENVNFMLASINTTVIPLYNKDTNEAEMVHNETKNNICLFDNNWLSVVENKEITDSNSNNIDLNNLFGILTNRTFDITCNDNDCSPIRLVTIIDKRGKRNVSFHIQDNFYEIENLDFDDEKKYYDQLFKFIALSVILVKKSIEYGLVDTIINSGKEIKDIDIIDQEFRYDVFFYARGYFVTGFNSLLISNSKINLNFEKYATIINTYKDDKYLIPTLRENIDKARKLSESSIEDNKNIVDKYLSKLMTTPIIIKGMRKQLLDFSSDIVSEFFNLELFIKLSETKEDKYLLMIMLGREVKENCDPDEYNSCEITPNTVNYYPVLALRQNDEIITTSFDNINNENIRNSFEIVQSNIIEQFDQYGLDLGHKLLSKFEKIDCDQIDKYADDIMNNGDYYEEDDDYTDSDSYCEEDIASSNSSNIAVKTGGDKRKKKTRNNLNTINNKIDYDKHCDDFNIFDFRDLVLDDMEYFVKVIANQYQFNITDYKALFNRFKDLVSCEYKDFYNDSNCMDFDFIEEAIQAYSFIINISTKDTLIDSLIAYYDDDENKYNVLRIGDKYGEYSSDLTKSLFFKYNRINTDNKINLNIICKEGAYNLALDQLCEYLRCEYKEDVINNGYDITQWILLLFEELFVREYSNCIHNPTRHNCEDYSNHRDRFDTYKLSNVLKCMETYLEEGIINEYDIDNIIKAFEFDSSSNEVRSFLSKEQAANRIAMTLPNGVVAYFTGMHGSDEFVIAPDTDNHLVDPRRYFSLSTEYNAKEDKPYNNYHGFSISNDLLVIDSLEGSNYPTFKNEMINLLKYLKFISNPTK